jgi:hypothetical protein
MSPKPQLAGLIGSSRGENYRADVQPEGPLEIVVAGASPILFSTLLLDIVARPIWEDGASDNVNEMIGPRRE